MEEILDGENIAIKFNIFEGEKILVERINVTGNNITNESVIRGELLLDEGDPYTQIKLDKSIAKIRSRNIFRNATSKVSNGSENNLKIIDIMLKNNQLEKLAQAQVLELMVVHLVFLFPKIIGWVKVKD